MNISVFDLFSVGIGPSSSHTVGPMKAARLFVQKLRDLGYLSQTRQVQARMYGSLGATGTGHGTDTAILLGLEGLKEDTVDVKAIPERLRKIRDQGIIHLNGEWPIPFADSDLKLIADRELDLHPNGMTFEAIGQESAPLLSRSYYSVGGGFVVEEGAFHHTVDTSVNVISPYPFGSATELLEQCTKNALSIAEIMMANEQAKKTQVEICRELLAIWQVMRDCVVAGLENEGELPGGLRVQRRAHRMHQQLLARPQASYCDPLSAMDWVSLYALAVNEENAAGGRVVTAPTNGAAGIIPAVLHYYHQFVPGANDEGIVDFLLTAGAVGILFKQNASISGAEVGCQGEVGSACSMAAAGLTATMGGTPKQVENAAEIAMEHNLGLTCDPIGGLVQIPCIERNAMAAIKAINAARISMRGDGSHLVSLDDVIRTMRETGRDMQDKYKETSRGGLAVNVVPTPVNIIEC
ncbi:L-serine ammonia-lyase [Pseudomaricurvus alkylphenolicus]|uniref:L-serine ammonia-lyase n=1 Tax=Pseudomaricurvus alkylphenolicus TaxID=1306991 RepID=UPI001422F025|nr:L-serine ammonia-lyase [Pseudomaricurvus alkylphenolicus]